MNQLMEQYIEKIHELIEIPRNHLRFLVYGKNQLEYEELLEKYENLYMEECLKIEEMLNWQCEEQEEH